MPKRLTKTQINEIIEKYQSGQTPKQIGEEYGIYNNSVTRILRKLNIPRTQQIRTPKEIIPEIIELYLGGMSSEKIATKFNLIGSTICRILKENNIKIRSITEAHRKYKIDTRFMQIIDTEEKAYFLGLMYSDGNVSSRGTTIKITLHNQDIDILQKLSNIIYGFDYVKEHKHTIPYNDGTPKIYNTLYIVSKEMKEDLGNLGCVPNKTFVIDFPNNTIVPENLKRHFIRGYLDGDGSISKYPFLWVNFSGNEKFINGLNDYLTKTNNIKSKLRNKKNTKNYSFDIRSYDNIIKFLDYIYEDSKIHLNRKYDKYLKLKEHYDPSKTRKYFSDDQIIDMIEMKNNKILLDVICEKYNISYKVLKRVIRNYEKRKFN